MSKEKSKPVNETNDATQQETKKTPGKVLNTIINVVLVIAILLAAVCTYVSFVSSSGNGVPSLFGVEIFSVQTDSMYPTLKAGDLIISHQVQDTSQLRVGDIITYWTIINGERALNTHRINEIYDGGGYLIFETKGDNNNLVDSLTVHESEVVGVYSSRLAGLGKVLDFLQTSTGFLIVVVIPVALFFLYQLVQFFRVLFEYQSVKNRLRFEEEQAARLAALDQREAEAAAAQPSPVEQPQPQAPPAPAPAPAPAPTPEAAVDREALRAELREQMKAEMMAEMMAELRRQGFAPAGTEEPKEEEKAPEKEPEEAPAAENEEAAPEKEMSAEAADTEAAPEPEAPEKEQAAAAAAEETESQQEEIAPEDEDPPQEETVAEKPENPTEK